MQKPRSAYDFVADSRISTTEQIAFRLAAAVQSFWTMSHDKDVVEIHLDGICQIGKSRLVDQTCHILWGEHLDPDLGFQKELFAFDRDCIERNGISIVSLDEGRRRFGESYAFGRAEVLYTRPTGKSVTFVENPCAARLDYETGAEEKTSPDIMITLTNAIPQMCQRLASLDPSLGASAEMALSVRNRAIAQGVEYPDYEFIRTLWDLSKEFANSSAGAKKNLKQAFHLRKVDSLFSANTSSRGSDAVAVYQGTNVPEDEARAIFRRITQRAYRSLYRASALTEG